MIASTPFTPWQDDFNFVNFLRYITGTFYSLKATDTVISRNKCTSNPLSFSAHLCPEDG